ncbi:MAG: AAA family ATPase [Hyphomicrobiales bacterium]|nr:AAA family ATPase [Hyphomicrobiales bacterium]
MTRSPPQALWAWLQGLGLAEYAPLFDQHHIDIDQLLQLSADDLREIGVVSVGHRRRLLAAIACRAKPAAMAPSAAHDPVLLGVQERQVTLLFCALAEPEASLQRHDPEDYRIYLAACRGVLTKAVTGFEGVIAQYANETMVCYFGYPQASGQDAERAVRAGLQILEDGARMPRFNGLAPQLRLGIATGVTLIDEQKGLDDALPGGAFGEVPNLAARIMAAAAPGTLVISPVTRALIGDLFECTGLGAHHLKGFAQAITLWQVKGRAASRSRFDAMRRTGGPVALVGRDWEVAELRRLYAAATQGTSQTITISGDAGTGKSRLVQHVFGGSAARQHEPFILQCSPLSKSVPLHPFRSYLEHRAAINHVDSDDLNRHRLRSYLAALWPLSYAQFELIDAMMQPSGADAFGKAGDPVRQRSQLLQTMLVFLEAMARRTRVFIVEDMHWADPTTQEVLEQFTRYFGHLQLLLVTTRRDGRDNAALGGRKLFIDRLDEAETGALVTRLAAPAMLPAAITAAIIERSDGVPLFAEELTRGYLDRDAQLKGLAADRAAIPATLAESLLARLDGLEFGRLVASAAAVLGREFSVPLLMAVVPLSLAEARRGLLELNEAGILVKGHSRYGETLGFRHTLVRDAAYQLLTRKDRHALHGKVVDALETRFPDMAAALPHVLAYQLAAADRPVDASRQWEHAGNAALKRSDYREAVTCFEEAIATNARLPDSKARDERELTLRIALVTPLVATVGFGHASIIEQLDAATLIGQRLGVTSQLVPLLVSKWGASGNIVRLRENLKLARSIAAFARGGPMIDRLLAHRALGTTLLFRGQLDVANRELSAFATLYEPERDRTELYRIGPSNPWVNTLMGLCQIAAMQNDFVSARAWQGQCLEAARATGQTNPQFNALIFAGCFAAMLMADKAGMNAFAGRLKSLQLIENQPFWRGHTMVFSGIDMIWQGDAEQGFALAHRGIAHMRETRAFSNVWQVFVAIELEKAGRLAECSAMLRAALPELVSGYVYFSAELHRLAARLYQAQGASGRARRHFTMAIRIARRQHSYLQLQAAEADLRALGPP